MFNQDDIDAYKKITVPPGLKAKIWQAHQENKVRRPSYFLLSGRLAAAGLAFILLGGTFAYGMWNRDSIALTVNGTAIRGAALEITDSPIENPFRGRSLGGMNFAFDFESRHSSELSVSEGELVILDDDKLQVIEQGSIVQAQGRVGVVWSLDTEEPGRHELRIKGRQERLTVSLIFDEETNRWIIQKESIN